VPAIDFLRRLLGIGPSDEAADASAGADTDDAPAAEPPTPIVPRPTAACPSCAFLLDPPPSRNRLCPRCRQPIVVRRKDGRLVLLTEAAVAVFEAERQREVDERTWTADRARWLALAKNVKAPVARRTKLAQAPLSAAVVAASRDLYMTTAERAVRNARRDKKWGDIGTIRRAQAAALYQEAGSPVPPPDEVVALHREGMSAVLRSLSAVARNAEVVGAECCKACRADDGTIVRIATELREPRLPHVGCPRGICACDWWVAVVERKPSRRRRPATRAPGEAAAGPVLEAEAGPAVGIAETAIAVETAESAETLESAIAAEGVIAAARVERDETPEAAEGETAESVETVESAIAAEGATAVETDQTPETADPAIDIVAAIRMAGATDPAAAAKPARDPAPVGINGSRSG
jgi:hypothetical protein